MKCPRCQHENRAVAKFCEECAAPLARTCANCGAQLSPTAKFCSECAHPAGQAAPPSATQRFGAPEAYTPRHLAEKILTSKAAIEGERKQVTILFADLRGSMELLADRDPEDARRLLDPVLEHMMEAVHRYEGTVNQVMGDGIMALFGAPLAHEDHAVRACYAALRMQQAVKHYAEGIRRTVGLPIQIRVGLNSGEVVVRSIGSDLRMDYTAVGQTTHLAARMEQMATPGSILIPAETLTLAEGYVIVTGLGAMPVKGLELPIEVYEVTGATTVRSRLHAAVVRGLTRFVGRDSEVEQLRHALDQARVGHGQVAAVMGEPGVGKSRLFWEFIHSHRTEGWLIVESSSVSYGKATAFLPLIDLLRAYFQIDPRDEARKIREKVTGKLLSLDRVLEPSLPGVLWLLDIPVEDPQWEKLEPLQRRQRTLDGVKRLLLRESQVQPVLVVFEDLHWIDAETQAFLDSLVESLPASRLLLLVNYRPEYQHGWSGKTYYRQLRIDALPPESADALLAGLLGNDPGLEPLKRLLIERTGGNPFFLEESVRTLIETKALTGERGACRLVGAPQSFQIPATAQAILASRIDRLSPEDKRLLQAAAVIGKDVPFGLLQVIADLPEEALRAGLAHLMAAEFLYEARLFPDLEYTFKHALMNDVAYGSLLHDRRRALHAKIVDAIETLHADRLAEHLEALAHHAFRSEVWEKAVIYLRQAGAKAFARSANREAVACFEQALAALQHLPETPANLELAIDLRLDLRNSLFILAELQKVREHLYDAERLARGLNDQRRLGWVSLCMSHSSLVSGYSTEACASGQTAYTIAETLEDVPLQIGAGVYLGAAHLACGNHRLAEGFLSKAVKSLEGDRTDNRFGMHAFPAVLSRFYLAWSLADRGVFDEAIAIGQAGVQIADAVNHPYSMVLSRWRLGYVYGAQGAFDEAVRTLERALVLARDSNLLLLLPLVTESMGYVYVLCGRVAEGLALLEPALQTMASAGSGQYHTLGLIHLGEACVLAHRREDAAAFASRAMTFAREHGQRGYEAHVLRLLGEIAADPGALDREVAEGRYREAMTLAHQLGMRPLLSRCHLALGMLYGQTENRREAREHLTTAAAMYREMHMRFWLEQAEIQLGRFA
jgi:class 3 adenylate cyclase/tetratricopeptide (TPR) repeat protein